MELRHQSLPSNIRRCSPFGVLVFFQHIGLWFALRYLLFSSIGLMSPAGLPLSYSVQGQVSIRLRIPRGPKQ